jgi:hypothetical protein
MLEGAMRGASRCIAIECRWLLTRGHLATKNWKNGSAADPFSLPDSPSARSTKNLIAP